MDVRKHLFSKHKKLFALFTLRTVERMKLEKKEADCMLQINKCMHLMRVILKLNETILFLLSCEEHFSLPKRNFRKSIVLGFVSITFPNKVTKPLLLKATYEEK